MGSYKHSGIKLDRKVRFLDGCKNSFNVFTFFSHESVLDEFTISGVTVNIRVTALIRFIFNKYVSPCTILVFPQILSELAANEPFAFRSVVQVVEHTSNKAK